MKDRVEMLVSAAQRYMEAVKRLGDQSGYNHMNYFEAPILKIPTPEMQDEARTRWIELNEAGKLLTATCSAAEMSLAVTNGERS